MYYKNLRLWALSYHMGVLYWSVQNTLLYLCKKESMKFYFSVTVDYLNGSTYATQVWYS